MRNSREGVLHSPVVSWSGEKPGANIIQAQALKQSERASLLLMDQLSRNDKCPSMVLTGKRGNSLRSCLAGLDTSTRLKLSGSPASKQGSLLLLAEPRRSSSCLGPRPTMPASGS